MPAKKTKGRKESKVQQEELPPEHLPEDAEWAAFTANMRRNVGRPSVYSPDYCGEVIAYFLSKPPYREVLTQFGPRLIANDLPTLAGFAVKIGVCKQTLHNWMDEHKEFLDAIARAKAAQEFIWATNTMNKLYDKTFAIFFGKNNYAAHKN